MIDIVWAHEELSKAFEEALEEEHAAVGDELLQETRVQVHFSSKVVSQG